MSPEGAAFGAAFLGALGAFAGFLTGAMPTVAVSGAATVSAAASAVSLTGDGAATACATTALDCGPMKAARGLSACAVVECTCEPTTTARATANEAEVSQRRREPNAARTLVMKDYSAEPVTSCSHTLTIR